MISQTWQKLIRLDPKNAKEVSFAILYIYFIVKILGGRSEEGEVPAERAEVRFEHSDTGVARACMHCVFVSYFEMIMFI